MGVAGGRGGGGEGGGRGGEGEKGAVFFSNVGSKAGFGFGYSRVFKVGDCSR